MIRALVGLALALAAVPAHAAVFVPEAGQPPIEVRRNPSLYLPVTITTQSRASNPLQVRADDTPWVYRNLGDHMFWIRRSTTTFRLMNVINFYDSPSGQWEPGANFIGGGAWFTDHNIAAYLTAPELTIEVDYPVGASPVVIRKPTTQTFRYNGGSDVTLTAYRAPEPSTLSMLTVCGVLLVRHCRRH